MRHEQIAERYAKGLYQLALENKSQTKVFEDLLVVQKVIRESKEIQAYFESPLVQADVRSKVLKEAFFDRGLSTEVTSFIMTVARKDRLGILDQMIDAYQNQIDAANSVTRGTVESAITLSPEERKSLESIVRKVTGKEVILTYKTNPRVIGGMVARVGGYTFDDTIQTHLTRMNEDLKRRVN